MLLHEVVLDTARDSPERVAVIFGSRILTFGELADRVRRTASLAAGLAVPGGRIAVVGANHPGWIELYYGVPASGRTLVFLNHRLSGFELDALLARSGASAVVGDPVHLERLRSAGATVELIDWDRWETERDRIGNRESGSDPEIDAATDRSETPAWLLFTSGTTAAPKGALLTHRSVLAAVTASSAARPVDSDDVYAFPFPLCHVAGYNVVHRHANGRPVVLLERFDPVDFCESVEANGATSTSLAATMLASLLDHLDAHPDAVDGLRSLRSIAYGAAPMPPVLLRRTADLLGVDFAQGYGMTELSGNAVFLDAEAHRDGLAGNPGILTAAGKPAAGVELRIADADDVDVEPGEIGEILVRAEQVMWGYLDDEQATSAALRGGWLHTGDVGRIDAAGYLHVVDRSKDIIITGGENVSSREVEDVLSSFPGVSRVAVVGVPDPRWGENVCAVIVPSGGESPDPAEIVSFARERLAGFKIPRHVAFVAELPVNASGKVLKAEIRAWLATRTDGAGPRL
jgi:acyl-CoA synthetase (AMP-forming)/AMP-acid ligase II